MMSVFGFRLLKPIGSNEPLAKKYIDYNNDIGDDDNINYDNNRYINDINNSNNNSININDANDDDDVTQYTILKWYLSTYSSLNNIINSLSTARSTVNETILQYAQSEWYNQARFVPCSFAGSGDFTNIRLT